MSSFSADPKAASASARESFSNVKDDLHRLKDDALDTATATAQAAKQVARKGIDTAKDYAQQGVDTARDYAKQGVDTANEYAKQANDYAMESYESACDFVRERPATAILIAVGVGAIISRMLLPRR